MSEFDFSKQPGLQRNRFDSCNPEDALVSIITPYYNAGKYFEQTFNCVMNQTFPWFEWIIVDDGTTDQMSLNVLEHFEKQDKRIRVFHQKNGGLSFARNTGINCSTTAFFIPLDADDLISPQYIEYLYWSLISNPDAAWSYSDCCGFQDKEYTWVKPFDVDALKIDNYLVATAMIRKADAEEIGCYKIEKCSYNEDWRFWLEMVAAHKKPVHVKGILFWYRRTNSMLTDVISNKELREFNHKIIKNAALKITAKIEAVEYPISYSSKCFDKPVFQKWNLMSETKQTLKKILWLVPRLEMGGADKFNLDVISGLTEKGYQNSILTTFSAKNEWLYRFTEYTDEIFSLPDFLDPQQFLSFVSYYIQTRQIEILMLTNSYDGYYMIPWLRAHFPKLVIVDYVHMEEWYWRKGGYARISGTLEGLSEKTWVCNSETKRVLTEVFGRSEKSVECLYIGVDEEEYDASKVYPGYLHEMLKLPKDRKIVLFPCRMTSQKRPFLMIEIAKRVCVQMPQVAFVAVGDGPQLEELKKKVLNDKLERCVFFIGQNDQMKKCYRDSSLTLICSIKEGLALTAYESCSMGIPVISSDVGGQADLIDETVGTLIPMMQNEESDFDARIYPVEEIDLYVQNIVRILSDELLRTALGTNARKRIEQSFTHHQLINKLNEEFEYLLNDDNEKAKREECSNMLIHFPGLIDEYYTSYQVWRDEEEKIDEIRREKFCILNQLEQLNNEKRYSLTRVIGLLGQPNTVARKVFHKVRRQYGKSLRKIKHILQKN